MEKVCTICGNGFYVKPSHYNKRTCCSRKCMAYHYTNVLRGENNPNYRSAGHKLCLTCGCHYHSYQKNKKYCSVKCRTNAPDWTEQLREIGKSDKNLSRLREYAKKRTKAARLQRPAREPKERIKYTCKKCGGNFRASCNRIYCPSCLPPQKEKTITKCKICGKETADYQSRKIRIVCSNKCRATLTKENQIGDKSHLWKGGITEKNMLIRNSADYKEWRKNVFERDDFTCQFCHNRGGRLVADHIFPFSLYPMLRLDPSNGRTLCWDCHSKLPTTGARLVNSMRKEKKKSGGVQLGLV